MPYRNVLALKEKKINMGTCRKIDGTSVKGKKLILALWWSD
jgi:hypothetical protein